MYLRKFSVLFFVALLFSQCTRDVILSDEREILSFFFPNIATNVVFNGNNIEVEVSVCLDVSRLAPIITYSPMSTISPRSGEEVDFTNPVVYTVTAQDGSTANYTVTVTQNLSRRNEILTFELLGTQQIFEREGDNLFIYVPYEADITNIQTSIAVSDMAIVNPENGMFMDFTNPQTFTVTSSNGISRDFVVTVKRSPWRQLLKHGEAPWGGRDCHGMFVFDNKLWILGGTTNTDVWNSADGINWNLVTPHGGHWGTAHKDGTVFSVFNGRIWAMGGHQHDVNIPVDIGIYSSSDGIHWDKHLDAVPFGLRYQPALVEFNGRLWLLGGQRGHSLTTTAYNDIWSSDDGINWVREVEYAAWQPRGAIYGGVVVFNGAMYLIGGGIMGDATTHTRIALYNDVWRSTDGKNWQRLLARAPWEGRFYHSVVVYNDYIYVIAGDSGPLRNDVWKSKDGINWEQVKHSFWRGRHAQATAVFQGKLFMTGGNLGGTIGYTNEVWVLGGTN